MPKATTYERDPDTPDEVNDCLELLLERIEVPARCWPHMRMTVAGSWQSEDRDAAVAWCNAGGEEPECVYRMRQDFARIQGVDPDRLKRL